MTNALVPAFTVFYDEAISPFVQWLGDIFKDGMDGAAGKMDEWAAWFEVNRDNIVEFAENLGKAVAPLGDIVIAIGDASWEIFKATLEGIDTVLKNIVDNLIKLDSSLCRHHLTKGIFSTRRATDMAKGTVADSCQGGKKQAVRCSIASNGNFAHNFTPFLIRGYDTTFCSKCQPPAKFVRDLFGFFAGLRRRFCSRGKKRERLCQNGGIPVERMALTEGIFLV